MPEYLNSSAVWDRVLCNLKYGKNRFSIIDLSKLKEWIKKIKRLPNGSNRKKDSIEFKLYNWCMYRRDDNKKGILSAERIEHLQAIKE